MIGKLQKAQRIFNIQAWKDGKLLGAGQDGSREWIILIASICIDGTAIPPAIIYASQSGNLQNSWVEDFYPETQACHFAASEKGWTNNELGLSWLEHVFYKHTKEKAA